MKKNKVRSMIGATILMLAGCSYSAQELIDNSTNVRVTEHSENYQEVFRRIHQTASKCLQAGFFFSPQASNEVDGQLYNELGFGEVNFYLNNLGSTHYLHWRIERAGDNSKVTLTAREYYADSLLDTFESWAFGSSEC